MKSFKQYTKLQEWTISDVQIAMKKKYGKIDTKAIEKLKKVQHLGNVDRNALVKVGHGKLHVESVELDEKSFLKKIKMDKFSRSERKRKKDIHKKAKEYNRKILGIESTELDEANLIVSFKTKEMMFERIYERALKLKFKNLFRSIKRTKPNASFDITFKGEEDELKKVAKYITGTLDKKNGIYDTHSISNVATKRIGEATERAYPVSYEKNKKLMALVNKYDDPLKFILKVMTLMNAGKLKLTRVGVANTREVAALWNAHKNKQIAPSLIEHLFSEIELLLDEN